MHLTKRITEDLVWVGASDRRLAMFEGVYAVPDGVSYNSYLLLDKKTVLFDTVDKAVRERFIENVKYALDGRELDYLVIQHMEPDHSAAIPDLLAAYPNMRIVVNTKTLAFIKQFYDFKEIKRIIPVSEADTLNTGKHVLSFIMAPMVHWPEVMVTYDQTDKILFSADAFGCFGALNGALFADEVDFERDYMDEARRYYTNIVGKYGAQVLNLLEKASAVPVEMICPLHGFVWRSSLTKILTKYQKWAAYEAEDEGVLIAYASVYGNTENAAEILASRLRDNGVKTQMFDVSVTPAPYIVSAAFKWSHLVFASTTYNAQIFVTMEQLLSDLAAHNIQNKTVAIIENGSWAPASGGLMREKFKTCKNISFIDQSVTIKSGLKEEGLAAIEQMAAAITDSIKPPAGAAVSGFGAPAPSMPAVDPATLFKLTYGLFILTARDNGDNGCVINTVCQITAGEIRLSVAVNKSNHTCDMIRRSGLFNISVLTESAPFSLFERFGFKSGKNADKFADAPFSEARAANGIRYIAEHTNAVISCKVSDAYDYDTHILFVADVTEAFRLSEAPSLTYSYYFENIKPKPQKAAGAKNGYVCKICGYIHEGDTLPDDFICPLCKHPASDFERL